MLTASALIVIILILSSGLFLVVDLIVHVYILVYSDPFFLGCRFLCPFSYILFVYEAFSGL